MQIEAGKYKSRSELEKFVRNKIGLTAVNKPDITIIGTHDELAKLHLSDSSNFWGISCEYAIPVKKPKKKKINRGEVMPHGINNKTK